MVKNFALKKRSCAADLAHLCSGCDADGRRNLQVYRMTACIKLEKVAQCPNCLVRGLIMRHKLDQKKKKKELKNKKRQQKSVANENKMKDR